MGTDGDEARVWSNICRENAWMCRICGAVPERGGTFPDNLCADSRKMVRSEYYGSQV